MRPRDALGGSTAIDRVFGVWIMIALETCSGPGGAAGVRSVMAVAVSTRTRRGGVVT